VITTIVLGYDLSLAFLERSRPCNGKERLEWRYEGGIYYASPSLQKLGLGEVPMETAVDISAGCHAVLGILGTPA
jgi:hypothetical protein